jgi:YidC/Oxa1 family membrane protein insertase
MDKKNTFLGVLFLGTAFLLMFWSSMDQQRRAAAQAAQEAAAAGNTTATAAGNVTANPASPASAGSPASVASETAPAASAGSGGLVGAQPATGNTTAATYVLKNDDIEATFTEAGGAILSVALNKYPAKLHGNDSLVFNEGSPVPMLQLALSLPERGGSGLPPEAVDGRFELVNSTKSNLTFQYLTPENVEVTRTYSIVGAGQPGDEYSIAHETTFTNHGTQPVELSRLFINAGMAPPTPGVGYLALTYLDFGYYDGTSARFVTMSQFNGYPGLFWGALPFGKRDPQPYVTGQMDSADIQWVSVKNQFFAAVLTPQDGLRGSGYYAVPVPLVVDGANTTSVTGYLQTNLGLLAPGQEKTLSLSYYVGPKDYQRLDKLGDRQDLVMEFGIMRWLAEVLLVILDWLHAGIVSWSPQWAWGWAIVIFTICIKLLTWPLTQIQVRSAKRMAKIQKPLAEIREKYKDNPQKLQSEMMELFKKNKVNPAAGCVPLFIQLPIFFAFYAMLRTASELRFASFLWVHDLSAPDTVGHIAGISVNILPLLMATTTFIQMRLTPSPTTDNTQRTILQFMPLMMLFFMYTMPAGMTLYWTCQNLFTIGQQLLTNRMKDDPGATPAAPATGPAKGLPRTVMKRR